MFAQGALANLGHIIAPKPIKNILRRHAIEPVPERDAYVVGDFLESALERDGCHGLLHGRSLDAPRSGDLLRIIFGSIRVSERLFADLGRQLSVSSG